jgi:hypothetical protein
MLSLDHVVVLPQLLKKPDQCRMVSLCSHLFWPPRLPMPASSSSSSSSSSTSSSELLALTGAAAEGETVAVGVGEGVGREEKEKEVAARYSDCERVLECMQRALKIASNSNPNLFVDILDRSVALSFLLDRC